MPWPFWPLYEVTPNKQLPSFNALIPIIYWHYKAQRSEYGQDSNLDSQNLLVIRLWLTKALLSGAFSGQSDTALYKCKEAIDKTTSISFPAKDIEKNIKTMKNRSMDLYPDFFDEISYKSKESYIFLSLSYKMAINFQPIPKGNRPEQDHIFSQDELKGAKIPKEKMNSIYNIRYVTLRDNRKKSNTPYSEWVAGLDNKEEVFKSHLIPNNEWPIDQFDLFLEERKKELLKQFEY